MGGVRDASSIFMYVNGRHEEIVGRVCLTAHFFLTPPPKDYLLFQTSKFQLDPTNLKKRPLEPINESLDSILEPQNAMYLFTHFNSWYFVSMEHILK